MLLATANQLNSEHVDHTVRLPTFLTKPACGVWGPWAVNCVFSAVNDERVANGQADDRPVTRSGPNGQTATFAVGVPTPRASIRELSTAIPPVCASAGVRPDRAQCTDTGKSKRTKTWAVSRRQNLSNLASSDLAAVG